MSLNLPEGITTVRLNLPEEHIRWLASAAGQTTAEIHNDYPMAEGVTQGELIVLAVRKYADSRQDTLQQYQTNPTDQM